MHENDYSVDESDDTVMAYAVDRRGSFLKWKKRKKFFKKKEKILRTKMK